MTKNSQKYTLTRKNGRVDSVTFTGKRGEILELVQSGKSNEDIIAAGFNKGTVAIVRWQAKKVGLFNDGTEAGAEEGATA